MIFGIKKIDKVVKISKEFGFPERDKEYWEKLPKLVISH